jgi:hypothetical protein
MLPNLDRSPDVRNSARRFQPAKSHLTLQTRRQWPTVKEIVLIGTDLPSGSTGKVSYKIRRQREVCLDIDRIMSWQREGRFAIDICFRYIDGSMR